MFKFNSRSAQKSFEDWAQLGATHHAVLMPGHQKEPFKVFSNLMNISLKVVI
jgi:L-arabinose isomerase